MKIKTSPLQFKNFQLLKMEYKCIFPNKERFVLPSKLFDKYQIDVDFIWKEQKDNLWVVMAKIEINKSPKPLSGYSIFVEGISFFKLSQNIEKKNRDGLLKFSATGIALQCLRDSVKNITAQGPFGKFILPTFDLNYLVSEKLKSLESKKKM